MKNFIIFLLLSTLPGILAAAEQSVALSIPDMNCPVCPITIKKSLQQLNGVKNVKISYAGKTAEVIFDDHLTSIKSLLQATENVGYPATVMGDN